MLSVEEQLKVITSGTMQIVPLDELKKKLERGVPLNIKLGVDPTSPDLHLGHAVPLRKMRQFQDLGHKVTLIIGNGTALIGDPSGRDSTRPPLTEEQVEANAATYVEQALKILDPERTQIVHNGEWLKPLDLGSMLGLMSKFNVARILEREDFHNRYTNGMPIALHEFIYPVLQAYDSVVIKADLEMGGNDQIFNLLAGRDLMEKSGMEPQVALTMPLLVGLDGVKKMSKSYKNYVGLTDPADEMFGKLMSINDTVVPMYYRLCSTLPVDEVDAIDAAYADGTADPYQLKRALARNICDLYHGEGAGKAAQAAFDAQFKKGELPENIAEVSVDLTPNDQGKIYLARVLAEAGLCASAGDARRQIDGGGVKIDQIAVAAKNYNIDPEQLHSGCVVQVGKRKFARLA
ncbi:tyrosine--tRNA ligase [Coriobacteriaceae bacterium BV3Ac1]|uniref:tyrosine--tRNA ligase n=1 Tax=Olegusella massiliensis TaxID=1776381 RepID=UPI0003ADAF59|nr:tyrosine--tRNA ligase [Olegusella massiliensis]ERL12679.1 tyrosine--tRNA ligase [Coriobacteriaceae bacterium BV3Ac1]